MTSIASASIVAIGPAAHASTTRYVAPTGTGTACTVTTPCGLRTALAHSGGSDEIILTPGNYRTPATAFTDSLNDGGHALNIHGVYGQPAPVIFSKASVAVGLTEGSTLSHLAIESTGSNYGLSAVGAYVDHVAVVMTAPNAVTCAVFGTLVDSLCLATGDGSTAVSYFNSAASPVTSDVSLRGVTAIADGVHGIAVHDEADQNVTLHLTMTNTIAKGGLYDLQAQADESTSHAVITTKNCDYLTTQQVAPVGSATITGTGQVQAAPRFVDPVGGNFAEKPGSATVNAGTGDSATDTDVVGSPRILGSAPDIGAYELPQSPSAHGLKITKATRHGGHLSVKINPKGLPTKVHLVASHAGHKVTSKAVSAGSGLTPKTVHLKLHGLDRHTHYKAKAIASNAGGRARSPSKTLNTK